MRVTTNTTYAVRSVVYLKDHPGEWATLAAIAKGTVVPYSYLSKILQGLVKAGFVESRKGKAGGFKLRKPPERISIYDILRATSGGAVLKTDCAAGSCGISKTCRTRGVWEDIGRIAGAYLASRKLSQL